MRFWRRVCGGLLAALVLEACGGRLSAQVAGCTLSKQVYTCDRAQFRKTLLNAKTAQADPHTTDRMVAAKLRDLVGSLGKAAPAPEQAADLTFSLIPVDTAGVMVGPAGVDLAVLRVYGPGAGTLLWVETLRGQPDMSWPATVQATINQFRAGFKR